MPKEARRKSATRAEPYPEVRSPTIRPGDKPSTTALARLAMIEKPAEPIKLEERIELAKAAPIPRTKKALAEKSPFEANIPLTIASSTCKPAVPESNQAAVEQHTAVKDETEEGVLVKKPKAANSKAAPKKSTQEPSASIDKPSSFLDIHIDGEEDGTIACYDTCSTVRIKINTLLGKDNKKEENLNPHDIDKKGNKKPFTKASFSRTIGVSAGVLATFLGAKKMMGGAESAAYPAAYAFFEKKRIFEGKKKTAARLKIEANRPNGLPFRDPNHIRILVGPGENPSDFLDEYGQ